MPASTAAPRSSRHTLSSFTSSLGINIYYELHGTGPNKLMLIAGLASSCITWEATIQFLLPSYFGDQAKEDDYEICVFDNRCVGDSTVVPAGFKIKDMALDAFDLLQHLGWRSRVFLAGVSMATYVDEMYFVGGMISQELALLAPKDTFAGIVFISTHAGRTIPPLKSAFSLLTVLFKKGKIPDSERVRLLVQLIFSPTWLSLPPSPAEISIFVRQVIGADEALPEVESRPPGYFKTNLDLIAEVLIRHGETKAPQTDLGRKGQVTAIQGHYVSKERLAAIQGLGPRVLVVTGTDDPLIRPKNSHHISRHTGGKLIVYPSKGHALFFEAYQAFHSDFDAFFRSSPHFISSSSVTPKIVQPCLDAVERAVVAAQEVVREKVAAVKEVVVEGEVVVGREELVMVAEEETDVDGGVPVGVAVAAA
ncbi:hypothetical protein HDU67_009772 [Dinochytrium kinnereticum]|nr:hypothetical protein HDU67_009772 [Dinochytrium kinnereticum]